MKKETMSPDALNQVYEEIGLLIKQKKSCVKRVVNDAMVSLYWEIGKRLSEEITGINKPEYGKRVVFEISKRLVADFGTGFFDYFDTVSEEEYISQAYRKRNEEIGYRPELMKAAAM